jgi:uncharacterized protein (UPF0333 family)
MASSDMTSTRTFRTSTQTPAPEQQPPKPKRRLHFKLNRKLLVLLVVLIVAIVTGYLLARHHQNQQKLSTSNPDYFTTQTQRLSKLIVLPSEKPTIATVKDTTKLTGQSFYKDATDGDILFVYSANHKAILYRPSTNMIINVSPVNVAPATAKSAN